MCDCLGDQSLDQVFGNSPQMRTCQSTTNSLWPTYTITNAATANSTIITSTTLNNVFAAWTNQVTATTNSAIWTSWADDNIYNELSMREYERQSAQRQPTPQEIHAAQEAKVRRDAHYAAIEVAKSRAEELLLSHLTPAQRADYARSKFFIVDGRAGERFKIRTDRGVHGNVVRMEGEREIESLCFRAKDDAQVPHCDHLLTQMLMIRHHREDVLKIAGRARLAA